MHTADLRIEPLSFNLKEMGGLADGYHLPMFYLSSLPLHFRSSSKPYPMGVYESIDDTPFCETAN